MDDHRFQHFFAGADGPQLNGAKYSVVQSPQVPSPLPMIRPSDLYQAAYEKAKQDYQLNLLFNPDFYEDGAGI